MKNSILFLVLLQSLLIFAQAPQKMSYQSVVRNSANVLVANQVVGVRLSIVEGSLSGSAVYSETHTVTTNANGLFTLEAGGGTPTQGVFANIVWSNGAHYIKSEIDPSGGTNYTLTSTKELLSVPYALNGITTAQANAISTQAAAIVAQAATIATLQAQISVLQKPQLTTAPIVQLSQIFAISGGTITSTGSGGVNVRGVVWNNSPSPTIDLSTKTIDGSGTGSFTSDIPGLTPETTYYVRAYATNNAGTTYGNEVSFTPVLGGIGTQIWTTKNLDVDTYSDGTIIPQVTDPTEWENLTIGAWCYYNNDAVIGATYGKLYNWYAVAGIYNEASKTDASQRKKLAPTGYHVPSDAEWTTLTDFLGGEGIAGGKMKEAGATHWNNPNTQGTNISGFTGLPGGHRGGYGHFGASGYNGFWWSSSEYYTWARILYSDSGDVNRNANHPANGFSVRCLKD